MNSIFKPSSTKCIHINGHPYVLHDFVLKKMSIFNALLFDEQFDQKDIRIELPDYTNNPQYSKAELDNYDEQIIDDIFHNPINRNISTIIVHNHIKTFVIRHCDHFI